MNSKVADRIATTIFYLIAATIVTVLVGLLGYIIFHGFSKLNLDFLTSPSSSFRAGGALATNYLTLSISSFNHGIHCSTRSWGRNLHGRIRASREADKCHQNVY